VGAAHHRRDLRDLRGRAEDEGVDVGERVAQTAQRVRGEVAVPRDGVTHGGVGELQEDGPASPGEQYAFCSQIGEWHETIVRRETRKNPGSFIPGDGRGGERPVCRG
jgi:hypothetical protein